MNDVSPTITNAINQTKMCLENRIFFGADYNNPLQQINRMIVNTDLQRGVQTYRIIKETNFTK